MLVGAKRCSPKIPPKIVKTRDYSGLQVAQYGDCCMPLQLLSCFAAGCSALRKAVGPPLENCSILAVHVTRRRELPGQDLCSQERISSAFPIKESLDKKYIAPQCCASYLYI